jgi:hypothetical protein
MLILADPNDARAAACFKESLELARAQGAALWQVRTAISYARLLRDQSRADEAVLVLDDALSQVRGDDPPIAQRARQLRHQIRSRSIKPAG